MSQSAFRSAVANTWTEFQVTDVDGRVQIAANKGDLTVQDDKGTTTVTQGQQTTRDDTTDTEKRRKNVAAEPGQRQRQVEESRVRRRSLRRIGGDWRGYDLDIDTVGTSGESRVPVEFLPVILLRAGSCRQF